MSKRVFAAVKIYTTDALLTAIDQFQNELIRESIKWVEKSNIHVTLKFFGETEINDIKKIQEVFRTIPAKIKPFNFKIKGCGVFPNISNPKVLWLGIDDFESLKKLNDEINKNLTSAGFFSEETIYKPHITIGRINAIKDKVVLKNLILKNHESFIQKVEVEDFILYESTLTKSGPIYKPIEIFNLNK